VLITQSERRASRAATASTSAGASIGSSPWTLTTICAPSKPSRAHASARRSLPLSWCRAVSRASMPCAAQAATISASSAATTTDAAPDCAARRATRTIMGTPPMSASGFLGRRVDASRAGTSTWNGAVKT
jgi:hypothetical protein